MERTQLLIIGAGPYGLAAAAYARRQGLDFLLLGEPMGFWKHHMPRGMLLRSPLSWHLDPLGIYTFEHYIEAVGLNKADVSPIPIELFLGYAQWFQQENRLQAQPFFVERLKYSNGVFEANLTDGMSVLAQNVLVAPGLRYFKHIPREMVTLLPADRYSHTCDLTDFSRLKGKRCLIIGGRQSAFEWAALLGEQGDAEVHIVHRHETPRFAESDWSWVGAMIDSTIRIPGWFRCLPVGEQQAIRRQFWAEGRLKIEPWLEPRIKVAKVRLWPSSRVVRCADLPSGDVAVRLDTGASLKLDYLILATGYKEDVARLPYLTDESTRRTLQVVEGCPVLDDAFQSSIPGLFFAGQPAVRDFGPFFGFVIGSTPAARIIVDTVKQRTSAL